MRQCTAKAGTACHPTTRDMGATVMLHLHKTAIEPQAMLHSLLGALGFDELADDHVALEPAQIVDEQAAVQMI